MIEVALPGAGYFTYLLAQFSGTGILYKIVPLFSEKYNFVQFVAQDLSESEEKISALTCFLIYFRVVARLWQIFSGLLCFVPI